MSTGSILSLQRGGEALGNMLPVVTAATLKDSIGVAGGSFFSPFWRNSPTAGSAAIVSLDPPPGLALVGAPFAKEIVLKEMRKAFDFRSIYSPLINIWGPHSYITMAYIIYFPMIIYIDK